MSDISEKEYFFAQLVDRLLIGTNANCYLQNPKIAPEAGDDMADKNRDQGKSKKAMTKKARLKKKKAEDSKN
jgi:hypothetical protein